MAYNPQNPNGQATAANSSPVVIASNQSKIPVEIAETQSDIHGQLIGVTRITQLVTKFFQQTPQNALNITLSGGATTSSGIGTGIFSTGTGATASVLAQTPATILYSAQYEAWAVLSGAYTAPTSAASLQRLGVLPTIDGLAFGYNGLTFGLWTRFNSVDTFTPQSSWNKDVLNGASTSTFRSNNIPVALAPTNMNMYRIRYGWYGAVTAYFEVYAPDGSWVLVHQVRTANSQGAVNMTNPNLPMTVEVSKTASDATNLSITCGGWAAGVTAPTTGMLMSGQQNIAALNALLILPTTGLASLSFSIAGTWVGTLAFQSSLDGITWNTLLVTDNTGTLVTQTTINGIFIAAVATQRFYRVIATAWTSGTATLVYYGSAIPSAVINTPSSRIAVTITAATGVAATLTIPAVVAQFHYITSLEIRLYSTAARVGAATPILVSTTNIPGAIAYTFETAGAVGTNTPIQGYNLALPLKSSVLNTATTIVAPAVVGGIWRITATYFTGA